MRCRQFDIRVSALVATMLFVFLAILPAKAISEPAPNQEKRSCIQAVDGYAYLSENMTLSQTRSAAFSNAKRQAVEMAKTYIKSKSQMEDFELKYDLVWSSAEGAVTVLEQKDLGIEENTRYHVWIKAEVQYSLEPKTATSAEVHPPVLAASMDPTMDSALPLKVKVWTNQKMYREKERIEIYIQGNRDFYARVVDITADGQIIQLLPNDYRTDNLFKAGIVYKIPDQRDQFDLTVSPPFGEDRIVVYASEVPVGTVAMESIGQGLYNFRGDLQSLGQSTRGIAVVGRQGGGAAEFYEAVWTFATKR